MEINRAITGLEQFKKDFKPFVGNPADWGRVDDALKVLKGISDTQHENGWISVKDRLPEPEEKVLIYTKTGCLKYAQYHDEPNVLNPWYVYEDQARAWTNVISYWMPLPSTEGLHET